MDGFQARKNDEKSPSGQSSLDVGRRTEESTRTAAFVPGQGGAAPPTLRDTGGLMKASVDLTGTKVQSGFGDCCGIASAPNLLSPSEVARYHKMAADKGISECQLYYGICLYEGVVLLPIFLKRLDTLRWLPIKE